MFEKTQLFRIFLTILFVHSLMLENPKRIPLVCNKEERIFNY